MKIRPGTVRLHSFTGKELVGDSTSQKEMFWNSAWWWLTFCKTSVSSTEQPRLSLHWLLIMINHRNVWRANDQHGRGNAFWGLETVGCNHQYEAWTRLGYVQGGKRMVSYVAKSWVWWKADATYRLVLRAAPKSWIATLTIAWPRRLRWPGSVEHLDKSRSVIMKLNQYDSLFAIVVHYLTIIWLHEPLSTINRYLQLLAMINH